MKESKETKTDKPAAAEPAGAKSKTDTSSTSSTKSD